MTGKPLVSVCIPARNAEKTLAETLDSVLRQSHSRLEIIVSDNHSTDGTGEVARAYSSRGVRCVSNDSNPPWVEKMPGFVSGFVNWNFVLSLGEGEFLCLYHADDVYEQEIIEEELELMVTNPRVGAVFTRLRTVGEDGKPLRSGCSRLPPEFKGRQIFHFEELFNAILKYGNFLVSPSVMLRRLAWEQAGGFDPRQYLSSADLEMWLRISRHYLIGIIDKPLVNYRVSKKQFGAQYHHLRTALADFFIVMDHFLALPEIRRGAQKRSLACYEMERSVDHIYCATNLMAQGQLDTARRHLEKALRGVHFMTAFKRPRRLIRLSIGAGMYISILMGLGSLLGKRLYDANRLISNWRQRPY